MSYLEGGPKWWIESGDWEGRGERGEGGRRGEREEGRGRKERSSRQ